MSTPTYIPIASITLGSSASSVTFSSIPQTYRDLVLVVDAVTSANGIPTVRFNGDSGTNYGYVVMRATNSVGSTSGTFNAALLMDNGAKTGNPFFVKMQIMDYSATDKHKTTLVRSETQVNDQSIPGVYGIAHRYISTSAVTGMSVNPPAGNFNTGSTFALYGIAS